MKMLNLIMINAGDANAKRVLCLGLNRSNTVIIDELVRAGCEVHYTDGVFDEVSFDFIVSFGYRHIIRPPLLKRINCPILNLHISLLPYNRGAHPNFWSFYDETPAGVTIHLIDEGLDTGPIIFQRRVHFKEDEATFAQTYSRLKTEIENLFLENLEKIIEGTWHSSPQIGHGTEHKVKDLPPQFRGWQSEIVPEILRLKSLASN